MAKAVKKVVKFVAPIAIGFIAGPAVGAALGVSSAVGTGIVAGATGGLIGGGGLKGALTGGLLGGLGGWAAGKLGGGLSSSLGSGAGSGLGGLGIDAYSSALSTAANPANLTLPAAASGFGSGAGSLAYGGAFGAGLGGAAVQQFGQDTSLSLGGTDGIGFLGQPQTPNLTLDPNALGGTNMQPQAQSQQPGVLQNIANKANNMLGTNMSSGDLIKGGIDVAKNLYQAQQLERTAEQMRAMADPYVAQRGAAIDTGLRALNDPTNLPYYDDLVKRGERGVKRMAAAAGNYYNPRTLQDVMQIPSLTALALQKGQIGNAGTVANAASGSPSTAASLYGAGAIGATANKSDLFNTLATLYG